MARVSENRREPMADEFIAQAREYALLKNEIDGLTARQKELREGIFTAIDDRGEADDKGHIWFDFEEPIEGFAAFQKQRRVKRDLNEDVAGSLIAQKGLEGRLYKTVRVVDEDAVMAALYEGILTEDEVDAMYPVKVSWALVPVKKR